MSLENVELYQRAGFGKEVDLFWSSAVGEYLQARARECYTAAIRGLKTCDPTDYKSIIRYQGMVQNAEWFETWLSEAMLDGLKSLDLLESGDVDE